ncbi:MAG: alpha/beta hydrolase [Acidobacteria bacterium]|nr:alpha/beta hydrolase [Acidobacteriota bacterium]
MSSHQSDPNQSPASSSEKSVLSFDGVPIHYQVQGSGTPTLFFVHGWSCHPSYWKAQVKHFAPHYKVVTIDLAGHGGSGLNRRDWTIPAFGQDVVAVADHLDLDEVVLVGHSMGGLVVLEAAGRMPERVLALVGVDTLFDWWARLTPEEREQRLAPFRRDFVATTQKWVRQTLCASTSDANLVEKFVAELSAGSSEVGIAAMEGIYEWGRVDFPQALERLRKPVFMIQAEHNAPFLQVVESFAASFESFEVSLVPKVGHFVMMEAPETFNRLLAQAIDKISQGLSGN